MNGAFTKERDLSFERYPCSAVFAVELSATFGGLKTKEVGFP